MSTGIGDALASSAINYGFETAASNREQEHWKENQGILYGYSQQAQRAAASNTVQGYRDAGLSPALAAAGNFSPAPMGLSPLGANAHTGSQTRMLDAAAIDSQIGLNKSTEDLQSASAAKAKEEAEALRIKNEESRHNQQVRFFGAEAALDEILSDDKIPNEAYNVAQALKGAMQQFPKADPEQVFKTLGIKGNAFSVSRKSLEDKIHTWFVSNSGAIFGDKNNLDKGTKAFLDTVFKATSELLEIDSRKEVNEHQLKVLDEQAEALSEQAKKDSQIATQLKHSDMAEILKLHNEGKVSDVEFLGRILFAVLSMFGSR